MREDGADNSAEDNGVTSWLTSVIIGIKYSLVISNKYSVMQLCYSSSRVAPSYTVLNILADHIINFLVWVVSCGTR